MNGWDVPVNVKFHPDTEMLQLFIADKSEIWPIEEGAVIASIYKDNGVVYAIEVNVQNLMFPRTL